MRKVRSTAVWVDLLTQKERTPSQQRMLWAQMTGWEKTVIPKATTDPSQHQTGTLVNQQGKRTLVKKSAKNTDRQ